MNKSALLELAIATNKNVVSIINSNKKKNYITQNSSILYYL